jgi:hypothetical protein
MRQLKMKTPEDQKDINQQQLVSVKKEVITNTPIVNKAKTYYTKSQTKRESSTGQIDKDDLRQKANAMQARIKIRQDKTNAPRKQTTENRNQGRTSSDNQSTNPLLGQENNVSPQPYVPINQYPPAYQVQRGYVPTENPSLGQENNMSPQPYVPINQYPPAYQVQRGYVPTENPSLGQENNMPPQPYVPINLNSSGSLSATGLVSTTNQSLEEEDHGTSNEQTENPPKKSPKQKAVGALKTIMNRHKERDNDGNVQRNEDNKVIYNQSIQKAVTIRVGQAALTVGTGGVAPLAYGAYKAYKKRGTIGKFIAGSKPLKSEDKEDSATSSRKSKIKDHKEKSTLSVMGVAHAIDTAKHMAIKKTGHLANRARYAVGSMIQGTKREKGIGTTLAQRVRRGLIPKELRTAASTAKTSITKKFKNSKD